METQTLEKDLRTKAATFNPEQKEGPIAKAIESQTAKLPSDLFLWASVGVMATSLTLKLLGKKNTALFIGQWDSPFLFFGIYNKLVNLHNLSTS